MFHSWKEIWQNELLLKNNQRFMSPNKKKQTTQNMLHHYNLKRAWNSNGNSAGAVQEVPSQLTRVDSNELSAPSSPLMSLWNEKSPVSIAIAWHKRFSLPFVLASVLWPMFCKMNAVRFVMPIISQWWFKMLLISVRNLKCCIATWTNQCAIPRTFSVETLSPMVALHTHTYIQMYV